MPYFGWVTSLIVILVPKVCWRRSSSSCVSKLTPKRVFAKTRFFNLKYTWRISCSDFLAMVKEYT